LLCIVASFCLVAVAGTATAPAASDADVAELLTHEEQIEDWRKRRHERLSRGDGWFSLVGLEWLSEGENRIGASEESTTRIPNGPADWGTLIVDGDRLSFTPAAGIEVGGEISDGGEILLASDQTGEPTLVRSGNLSFYVIHRQSYALRIKDSQAPALLAFSGIENYPFQADWRIQGRFVPAAPGETIEIGNVLGQVTPEPVFGTFEFEREGRTHRLIALGKKDSEELWFLFADRTTGRETYGAGRFLYSDGMPADGRLVVDFNKAYNPPCAFNDYSTCPLPPLQNRLDMAVAAGEKNYHH
jgi:uncharacterized protein (DUF1684 family)